MMKTLIRIVLGTLLLAASCSAGRYADGTHEGRFDDGEYPVVVSVEVRNGRIVDVRAEDAGGGHGLFDAAFADIKKSVISKQRWDVDAVAGATVSSDGIIKAIKAALAGDS